MQQAPPAIIPAVLRRFRGPALFRGLRPSSSQGAPFWPSGLTLRSSGPAFCGPLTLAVRCHCAAAPPPCCISMEIYYASNADRKKWNLPNWLFCSGKYVRAKCKCKTSHPKKRNLSNWLECTGQLLRSKFEQSKNCHPKKWNLSHRL